MKLTFRGWQRVALFHYHDVTPVQIGSDRGLRPASKRALIWKDANTAYGKISDVALSGAFLVTFEFEQADLEGWLAELAKSKPEEALRLVAKVQAEALINLAKPVTANS